MSVRALQIPNETSAIETEVLATVGVTGWAPLEVPIVVPKTVVQVNLRVELLTEGAGEGGFEDVPVVELDVATGVREVAHCWGCGG